MYKLTEQELFGPPPISTRERYFLEICRYIKSDLEPDPYVIETDDNGFFPSLKEANQDPLSKLYTERAEKLSELQEHYRDQPPFANDDIRRIRQQQEKYELKKLLNNNVEKITLPSDRPHYGPGAIVPNSVLVRYRIIFLMISKTFFGLIQAKLLWPNRQPKKHDQEEWLPPILSDEQLQALEKNKPIVSVMRKSICSSLCLQNLAEKTREFELSQPVVSRMNSYSHPYFHFLFTYHNLANERRSRFCYL